MTQAVIAVRKRNNRTDCIFHATNASASKLDRSRQSWLPTQARRLRCVHLNGNRARVNQSTAVKVCSISQCMLSVLVGVTAFIAGLSNVTAAAAKATTTSSYNLTQLKPFCCHKPQTTCLHPALSCAAASIFLQL